METFPCTSCGACCQDLRPKKEQLKLLRVIFRNDDMEIPFAHDENGMCSMYNSTERTCRVYLTRPLPCRIVDMAEALKVPVWKAVAANIKWCNKEITERNLGEQFIIKFK